MSKREGHAKHPFSWAFYSSKKQPKLFLKAIKLKLWPLSCSSVEHITFQHTVGEDTIMQIYVHSLKKGDLDDKWSSLEPLPLREPYTKHGSLQIWGVLGIANTVLRHFKEFLQQKKIELFSLIKYTTIGRWNCYSIDISLCFYSVWHVPLPWLFSILWHTK